jgi:GxxExxY protein
MTKTDNSEKQLINSLSKELVDIFYKIHTKIGPGLLESVYEEVICFELSKRGIKFTRQQGIPFIYEDVKLELGFRSDIIVENCILIELKSVETLIPVHFKRTLSYLRLTNLKIGLLVNFNENLIKDGIHRIANNF